MSQRVLMEWPRQYPRRFRFSVAHTLLCIAWAVMKHDADYAEAGPTTTTSATSAISNLARHHQQALARLGYQVTLLPPADVSPPPATGGTSPQHPAA